MNTEHSQKVLVIGSGVIGTACAHYLSRAGWPVTILDRGAFGQGCSHANCGIIASSHVLPLAGPGVIGPTIRAMFRKNSPLIIKPRLDLELARWLLKFIGRCTKTHALEAGRALAALLNSSVSLYHELMATESLNCEWETKGCLFTFQSARAMNHFAQTDQLLREQFALSARRLNGEELLEMEPALKPGLAGAWYYERDCHLRPDRLLSSWKELLTRRGVQFREQCDVLQFHGEHQTLRAVATTQGEIEADAFVVATGAWTPLLNKHLGCRIPIQPGKGYSLTMPRPAVCPKFPLLLEEHRVAVTPMQSGYRLGSLMEFAGYDASINPRRLKLLKDGAAVYLREPHCEPVEEQWIGWRPMTYDGKPIIDRSPAFKNVLIAAGHNMLGLTLAPATGKLVAELLNGEEPHLNAAPYAVSRF